MFNSPDSTHDTVAEAGYRYFLLLNGAPLKETFLNYHRYNSFRRSISKIKLDISALPPTEGAKQHAFRVYYQVQLWLGNELPPEQWGWELKHTQLKPVPTKEPVAPEEVLRLVFCKCTTGCGAKCRRRKSIIHCISACSNYHGDCINKIPLEGGEENEEKDELFVPLIEHQPPIEED